MRPRGICATASQGKRLQQLRNFAGAVGERIEAHSGPVEQRQVQIRERRRLRVFYVASSLSSAATGDQDREVGVIVLVAVAHPAAVKVNRVVQQRSIAI